MQRFLLPAWVGAAVLFVVTSVAEQQFEGFASTIKNQLALIRFPLYYAFGFVMLLTSLSCGTVRIVKGVRDASTVIVFALLLLANVLMIVDFLFIYQPLANIMVDVLRPRDDEFMKYHQLSKYINGVNVFVSAIAAVFVCREPAASKPTANKVATSESTSS